MIVVENTLLTDDASRKRPRFIKARAVDNHKRVKSNVPGVLLLGAHDVVGELDMCAWSHQSTLGVSLTIQREGPTRELV